MTSATPSRVTQPGIGARRAETEDEKRVREIRERIQADPEAVAALKALADAQKKEKALVVPISALEEAREELEKAEARARRSAKVPTPPDVPAERADVDGAGEPPENLVELTPALAPTDTTQRGPAVRVGASNRQEDEVLARGVEGAPRGRKVVTIVVVLAAVILLLGLVWYARSGDEPPAPRASSGAASSGAPALMVVTSSVVALTLTSSASSSSSSSPSATSASPSASEVSARPMVSAPTAPSIPATGSTHIVASSAPSASNPPPLPVVSSSPPANTGLYFPPKPK